MPLINILDLKEDIPQRIAPPIPAVSYSGTKHGMEIHVVRNGMPLLLLCIVCEQGSSVTCRLRGLLTTAIICHAHDTMSWNMPCS